MATIEQFGVLLQLTDQSYRLTRNLRQNAADYLAKADAIEAGTAPAGLTASALGQIMRADAAAFLARIATITAIVQRNQALVQNALGIIGETLASANGLKTTLTTVCQHTQAATLQTTQQIRDEASYILANVPGLDGLY